jgi:hypothetical protein
MASALERYLELVDPARAAMAPMVVELDRIVRAHAPALQADVRYKILMYGLEGDYRNWVCAVDLTKKGACLRFLFGTQLSDPARRLRPGTGVLATLDFGSLEAINEAEIAPYIEEAVARYPEAVLWLKAAAEEKKRSKAESGK